MLSALKFIEVKCGDVNNAYITAPITEKVWSFLGLELRVDAGRKAIIIRALYILKSDGAAFRSHLWICMRGLVYEPCLDDTDLWYKAEVQPYNRHGYYFHIICCVDDILVINHDSLSILKRIESYFKIKPTSIGDTNMYLGAKVKEMKLEDRTWC